MYLYKYCYVYFIVDDSWGSWGEWELWKCNPAKGCLQKRKQTCNGTSLCKGKQPEQSMCKYLDFMASIIDTLYM